MPLLKFSHIIFFTLIVTGTIIALSGNNWLSVLAGIELNLLAFIPLIVQHKTAPEHESATKYLLTQVLGAFTLILAGLWIISSTLHPYPSKWLLFVGLIIKVGAAPTHFWFPNVMSGLSWPICLILSTWQKLFPLLCIFSLPQTQTPLPMLALFTLGAILSAHSGLNQTSLRGLLAYSSITHINWILSIALFNTLSAILYLSIYIFTTTIIIISLNSLNLSSQKLTVLSTLSYPTKIVLSSILFSLARLPPFLGFLPKWQGLETLSLSTPLALLALIFASLTTLFFYLKLSFFLFLTPSNKQTIPPSQFSFLIIPPFLFSLNLLPLTPLFIYALIILNKS